MISARTLGVLVKSRVRQLVWLPRERIFYWPQPDRISPRLPLQVGSLLLYPGERYDPQDLELQGRRFLEIHDIDLGQATRGFCILAAR